MVDTRGASAHERSASKLPVRSPKGTATTSHGHLNLNTIITYEYQLSVGGQVVTEEEWQQLVNAKTPLVQFRGEWMELDRDKMQQLLEFWQTHQHEDPEITLLDLLKIGTEAEDDLEWDHDQTLQDMLSQLHDKNAFALLKIHMPYREPCATTRSAASPGCSIWKIWA